MQEGKSKLSQFIFKYKPEFGVVPSNFSLQILPFLLLLLIKAYAELRFKIIYRGLQLKTVPQFNTSPKGIMDSTLKITLITFVKETDID